MKMLLGRGDVNPDKPDTGNHGRTPLQFAAWNEHEGAVEALRRGNVNPNKPDHPAGPRSRAPPLSVAMSVR